MPKVSIVDRQYYLVARDALPSVPLANNGLISASRNVCVLLTGTDTGEILVHVQVLPGGPDEADEAWDEVVEVDMLADNAVVLCEFGFVPVQQVLEIGGRYRVRAHARGRDEAASSPIGSATNEEHLLQIWPVEGRTGERVLRARDRFGAMWREG